MKCARRSVNPFHLLLATVLSWTHPGAASAQLDSTAGLEAGPGVDLFEEVAGGQFLREDDSLQLRLFAIETERIRLQLQHTNLWHRLIAGVHFSASFGWKDIIFLDPATMAPSILPKDAYRITIGLSLADVLDGSQHDAAGLLLKKVEASSDRVGLRRRQLKRNLELRLRTLTLEARSAEEEKALAESELRFNEMRFRQGKIEYDLLMRSKLRLVELKTRGELLRNEAGELQDKLTGYPAQ